MTDTGQLRHWLTFQQYESTQDSDGALDEAWLDAFEVNSRMPCRVETLSGRELLAAQAISSRVTHRITARNRPGFSAAQRAIDQSGRIYDLEAVMPDERGRMVIILASSGVNAGGTAA